ncbi:hypothetical protein, partial [Aeromonas rivipollensis]|uniref:hypothetical protein n=1 Tax=Aeromonas rivipollensis TaxID=948519 RepID=UPI003D203053
MREQMTMPLVPVRHQSEADGFEMGVMSDGTPYLTASGLAFVCGTARSNIITLVSDYSGQLNPDTWLGRSSAFAGALPSLC